MTREERLAHRRATRNKDKDREYREKHKEEIKVKAKLYNDATKEIRKAKYVANRDRYLAEHKVYREKNRDTINKKLREYAARPEVKERTKDRRLQKTYGITLAEYNEMAAKQNGRCPLCELAGKHETRRLFVDHCHKTGEVRGLLCNQHNTAIGLLEENRSLLSAGVIAYLERKEVTRGE